MRLSSSQRVLARQMLGLGNRNSRAAFYPVPCLDALVAMGGAIRTDGLDRQLRRRVGYTLTRAGAEAVLRPGETVDAIYFPEEENC